VSTSRTAANSVVKMEMLTAEDAVSRIEDECTLTTGGLTTTNLPFELFLALRERFLKTGRPRQLTVLQSAGQSGGNLVGFDAIGVEGLISKLIFSHSGKAPSISELVMNNKVIAYCLPQGVICQMFRDIAAKKPCVITHTGLHTFVDPRLEGGKVNAITKSKPDLVKLIEVDGKEYLRYKTMPIDFALIRGTTSDEKGNISMEKEGVTLENLSMAQATKNSGGKVAVQVEKVVSGFLPSRTVVIPGIFVDYVIRATKSEYGWQTSRIDYRPAISGATREPRVSFETKPLDERKIIGRRALMEVTRGDIINLGIGMATEVANVSMEENIFDQFTLTVESGPIGGVPLSGCDFGLAINYEALIDEPSQFDFYQGGGLDLAFLGMAQVDQNGNVNVSKFSGRFAGCGGFIDISQNAKKLVFCGTMTTKGLDVAINDGRLQIKQEGSVNKFLKNVEHITFSGEYARKLNKEVMYVTERAVFRLSPDGPVLEEIAPGVDLDQDVLARMDFSPAVSKKLKFMDEKIFQVKTMNIATQRR